MPIDHPLEICFRITYGIFIRISVLRLKVKKAGITSDMLHCSRQKHAPQHSSGSSHLVVLEGCLIKLLFDPVDKAISAVNLYTLDHFKHSGR